MQQAYHYRLLRDIEALESVALKSETKVKGNTSQPQKSYWLDRPPHAAERARVALTEDQMRLMQLSRELAAPFLPEDAHTALANSLNAASVLLPPEAHAHKATRRALPLVQPAIVGGIDYGPFQTILQTVLTAMEKRTVCLVTYTVPGKTPCEHEMAITGMVSGRLALYLNGWKVADKGTPYAVHPLFLAVHRISAVESTRRTHNLLPPPENEGFGIMDGEPFTVRVRVEASAAAYARERYFGPDQHIEDLPGGEILVSFTARSEPEVLSWALSFGASISVIEPDWLVDDIRDAAQNLLKKHST